MKTTLSERAALAIARNRATADAGWESWNEVPPSVQWMFLRKARFEVAEVLRNREPVVGSSNQTATKREV